MRSLVLLPYLKLPPCIQIMAGIGVAIGVSGIYISRRRGISPTLQYSTSLTTSTVVFGITISGVGVKGDSGVGVGVGLGVGAGAGTGTGTGAGLGAGAGAGAGVGSDAGAGAGISVFGDGLDSSVGDDYGCEDAGKVNSPELQALTINRGNNITVIRTFWNCLRHIMQ
jgi:hypothetical protein